MDRIGLALVGCGAIAQWHRMALAGVPALEVRACVDPLRERAEAQGEITIAAGVKLYDSEHPRGKVVKADLPEPMKDVPAGYMASYAGELLDFARAIREGKPLAAGPEVAVGELRIAQAMERSARTKHWEKVWA